MISWEASKICVKNWFAVVLKVLALLIVDIIESVPTIAVGELVEGIKARAHVSNADIKLPKQQYGLTLKRVRSKENNTPSSYFVFNGDLKDEWEAEWLQITESYLCN